VVDTDRFNRTECSTLPFTNKPTTREIYLQNTAWELGNYSGKTVLLQAWSSPEGSRKLRFPVFMTTAKDGGKVVSLTHRPPLPSGNTPGIHFC